MDSKAGPSSYNKADFFIKLNYDARCVVYSFLDVQDPLKSSWMRLSCHQALDELDKFTKQDRCRFIHNFNRTKGFLQLSTLEEPGTEVGAQPLTINVYMQGHVTTGDFNPMPPADKHHKDMMAYLLSWYVLRLHIHLKPMKSCIAPGRVASYWLRTMHVPINIKHFELSWADGDVLNPVSTKWIESVSVDLEPKDSEPGYRVSEDDLVVGKYYAYTTTQGRITMVSPTRWQYRLKSRWEIGSEWFVSTLDAFKYERNTCCSDTV
jgi:hypothetical protein